MEERKERKREGDSYKTHLAVTWVRFKNDPHEIVQCERRKWFGTKTLDLVKFMKGLRKTLELLRYLDQFRPESLDQLKLNEWRLSIEESGFTNIKLNGSMARLDLSTWV